jgi:hypothetical protein
MYKKHNKFYNLYNLDPVVDYNLILELSPEQLNDPNIKAHLSIINTLEHIKQIIIINNLNNYTLLEKISLEEEKTTKNKFINEAFYNEKAFPLNIDFFKMTNNIPDHHNVIICDVSNKELLLEKINNKIQERIHDENYNIYGDDMYKLSNSPIVSYKTTSDLEFLLYGLQTHFLPRKSTITKYDKSLNDLLYYTEKQFAVYLKAKSIKQLTKSQILKLTSGNNASELVSTDEGLDKEEQILLSEIVAKIQTDKSMNLTLLHEIIRDDTLKVGGGFFKKVKQKFNQIKNKRKGKTIKKAPEVTPSNLQKDIVHNDLKLVFEKRRLSQERSNKIKTQKRAVINQLMGIEQSIQNKLDKAEAEEQKKAQKLADKQKRKEQKKKAKERQKNKGKGGKKKKGKGKTNYGQKLNKQQAKPQSEEKSSSVLVSERGSIPLVDKNAPIKPVAPALDNFRKPDSYAKGHKAIQIQREALKYKNIGNKYVYPVSILMMKDDAVTSNTARYKVSNFGIVMTFSNLYSLSVLDYILYSNVGEPKTNAVMRYMGKTASVTDSVHNKKYRKINDVLTDSQRNMRKTIKKGQHNQLIIKDIEYKRKLLMNKVQRLKAEIYAITKNNLREGRANGKEYLNKVAELNKVQKQLDNYKVVSNKPKTLTKKVTGQVINKPKPVAKSAPTLIKQISAPNATLVATPVDTPVVPPRVASAPEYIIPNKDTKSNSKLKPNTKPKTKKIGLLGRIRNKFRRKPKQTKKK